MGIYNSESVNNMYDICLDKQSLAVCVKWPSSRYSKGKQATSPEKRCGIRIRRESIVGIANQVNLLTHKKKREIGIQTGFINI